MARTTHILKRQHGAATAMIEQLLDRSGRAPRDGDSEAMALQLTKLVSLLRLHFMQEDCTLYGPLLDSSDTDAARVARDYFEELHGLADTLDLFAYRWCDAAAIAAGIGRFRHELQMLCDALLRRIALEEAYLYPLLERRSAEARRAA